MCFQFTHFPCDDWENIYTLSYYHHQIGSMNYYPLFRVRSWNNGVCCMCFYILIYIYIYIYIFRVMVITVFEMKFHVRVLQLYLTTITSWFAHHKIHFDNLCSRWAVLHKRGSLELHWRCVGHQQRQGVWALGNILRIRWRRLPWALYYGRFQLLSKPTQWTITRPMVFGSHK